MKNIFKLVKVDFDSETNSLVVGLDQQPTQYYYACYLYVGNELIEVRNYTRLGSFDFIITKSGNYKIRFYIRDVKNDIRIAKNYDLGFVFKASKYYTESQNKYLNELNMIKGENLYLNSSLDFNGFNDYKFESKIDFSLDPYNNRTWRWNLLQLSILNQILSYYSKNKNKLVLKYGFDLIENWYEYSLVNTNDSELWHDHGSALRLQNISFYFCYVLKEKYITYQSIEYEFLKKIINKHLDFLVNPDFYSKNTNHGFDQSLVLYQVSSELESLFGLTEYISLAECRIVDEIRFAFCEDGGHKENSPAYLNFGIKQCLLALNLEQSYKGEIEAFKFVSDIVDLATEALTYTTKPDGLLPLIGDTSYYKVTNIFGKYKPKNYNEFIYATTEGKRGVKPSKLLHVLPETGYAFYRSHWNRGNFKDAVYLSLKAGYHSNYHRHDDDLSITLYAYGEDWLVDGGVYKYDNKDVNRKYIRSSRSHNLMVVKDEIAKRDIFNIHKVKINEYGEIDKNNIFIDSYSKMFDGYTIRRFINIVDGDIVIEDTCKSNSCHNFDVVNRMFFDFDKSIAVDGNTVTIFGNNADLKLNVSSDSAFEIKLNPKVSKVDGWLSKNNNKLYLSQFIEFHSIGNFSTEITFKFHLSFNVKRLKT